MYSPLQTRNTQGLRGVGRLAMLGAVPAPITAAEAVQQAMATESSWNPRDSQSSTFTGGMAQEVEAGQISAAAFSPTCAGSPAPNVNLFQTATGLTLGVASAGVGIMGATGFIIPAAAIPVAGAVIAAAGIVIQMIGTIFAHHAAAARQEQALGCAAIAAANNSMNLIRQAVANGQMTPAAASGALDTLVQQFSSYVAPSVGHNPCNADCELTVAMKAIAIYWKSQFDALAASAASSATTPGAPTPTPPVNVAPGVTVGGLTLSPLALAVGAGILLLLVTR
jgi:hypothetical protein